MGSRGVELELVGGDRVGIVSNLTRILTESGVSIEHIRQALNTFQSGAQQTPGRMNLFNLGRFHALVDYAHNPASYEALGGFVKNWPGRRIGVVGGPGDRDDGSRTSDASRCHTGHTGWSSGQRPNESEAARGAAP